MDHGSFNHLSTSGLVVSWLGFWTYDLGLTPGQVAVKWLLPGWVTACGQVNHLGV